MATIKNKSYRQFIDDGMIVLLNEDHIVKALNNIHHKNLKEARSLLICMYATGARPNEVLKIKSSFVRKEPGKIYIKLPPSKNGLWREVPISIKKMPMIKEFADFALALPPEMYLFYNFIGQYKRTYKNKKGEIKEYNVTTDKLRYHVYKWFENVIDNSISPYFLRHNRFSKMMAKGASLEQVRQWKGAKSINSVYPYVHLSKEMADKASKFVD